MMRVAVHVNCRRPTQRRRLDPLIEATYQRALEDQQAPADALLHHAKRRRGVVCKRVARNAAVVYACLCARAPARRARVCVCFCPSVRVA